MHKLFSFDFLWWGVRCFIKFESKFPLVFSNILIFNFVIRFIFLANQFIREKLVCFYLQDLSFWLHFTKLFTSICKIFSLIPQNLRTGLWMQWIPLAKLEFSPKTFRKTITNWNLSKILYFFLMFCIQRFFQWRVLSFFQKILSISRYSLLHNSL